MSSQQSPIVKQDAPISSSADRPAVVILVPDLFLGTRIEDVVRSQGGRPVTTDNAEAFVAAVDHSFPALALLDLASQGDWFAAIQRCKLRPHTRQIPLYAFGSHMDVETLRRARRAGADHAWARSRMMEELADVVNRHVHPPTRYPAGWNDALSATAAHGVEEFNRGGYFEQHELLEAAWLEETRPIREMYQGILQIGVAFLQIQRGNWAGAVKMFRRGLPRLTGLPEVCQGLQLDLFRRQAEAIHTEVTDLGPERLNEFDQSKFPRIEYAVAPALTNPAPTD